MDPQLIMTVSELFNITEEKIDWVKYLRQMFPISIDDDTLVYVRVNHDILRDTVALFMRTPKRVLANFILWKVVYDMIDFIQDPTLLNMKQEYRDSFYNFKSTRKEGRWNRCLRELSTFLTPALTMFYAKRFFPLEDRKYVLEMFRGLTNTTGELIENVTWLNNSTVERLLQRLSQIGITVGYPDNLLKKDVVESYYGNLSLSEDEYLFNILNLRKFQHQIESEETLLNTSKNNWVYIESLLHVNAYYFRFSSSIVIPVTQLQGVYYGRNRLTALNYGSLGAILGHELFHGLNEFGLGRYLHNVNWWKPEDTEAFQNRSKCLEDQYSKFQIFPKSTINGSQTLDENLADNSGLKVAYLAYRSWVEANGEEPPLIGMPSLTGNQIFWLAFANAWCSSTNKIVQQDSDFYWGYSPNKYRVIGSVQNMEAFAKDFGCPSGSPMNPENKCAVW